MVYCNGLLTNKGLQILLNGSNNPTTLEEHLNKIYITILQNSIQLGYTKQER